MSHLPQKVLEGYSLQLAEANSYWLRRLVILLKALKLAVIPSEL